LAESCEEGSVTSSGKAVPAIFRWVIVVALALFMAGCAATHRAPSGEEGAAPEAKVRAEAYLFDARMHREGKMNTFRLEIFQTDSILGLGGRGYLGKGVLKGWLTRDSLEAFFPTVNEWVYASVGGLLASSDCPVNVPDVNLLSLFTTLPDSMVLPEGIVLQSDYEDSNHPKFSLFMSNCSWRIDVEYDHQESGWRIEEFFFTDGVSDDLRTKRREYREDVTVNRDKFELSIPADARRIIP
jgi:hypothetical protein